MSEISSRVGALEEGLKALLDLTVKIREKYSDKLNAITNSKMVESNTTPSLNHSYSITGKSSQVDSPAKPKLDRQGKLRIKVIRC